MEVGTDQILLKAGNALLKQPNLLLDPSFFGLNLFVFVSSPLPTIISSLDCSEVIRYKCSCFIRTLRN